MPSKKPPYSENPPIKIGKINKRKTAPSIFNSKFGSENGLSLQNSMMQNTSIIKGSDMMSNDSSFYSSSNAGRIQAIISCSYEDKFIVKRKPKI